MTEHEHWASLEDVAEHLGVAKDSVYRWIDHRGLPAHKIGRLWKFKLSEVDTWVRAGGVDAHLGRVHGGPACWPRGADLPEHER